MRNVKPFNAGTMTSAAFFGMIRSTLRKRSQYWKPSQIVKQAAKRPYTGDNPRQKFEYMCNICKEYFPGKEIAVDHIVEVGSLTCYEDLPAFCEALFCEESGLQTACKTCHDKKTKAYMDGKKLK